MDQPAEQRFWTRGLTNAVLLAGILIVILGFFTATLLWGGLCGGDGGSPYAAPASPRGKACAYGPHFFSLFGPGLVLAAGLPIATVRRSRAGVFVVLAIALAMAIIPLGIVGALPGECAGDDPDIENLEEFGNYDCH